MRGRISCFRGAGEGDDVRGAIEVRSRGLACAIGLTEAHVSALIEIGPLASGVKIRSEFLRGGSLSRVAWEIAIQLSATVTLHAQHPIVFAEVGFHALGSDVICVQL